MGTRLVQGGWEKELKKAIAADCSLARIVSPFIKRGAVENLFGQAEPEELRVLTRFNLDHFSEGISDLSALRLLLDLGAQVRGIKRLHAKAYLLGSRWVLVASTNLTEAGLAKNHELGVIAEGGSLATQCGDYFDGLWDGSGGDLTAAQVDAWEEQIENHHQSGAPSQRSGLGDMGTDLKSKPEFLLPAWFDEPREGFVKFFGEGHRRASRDELVFDEVKGAGCHWACTYPLRKRPRAPKDGAVMFMGRLVHSPNDTLIYGRAVAMHHEPGRDDASPGEVKQRLWKKKWPHYIRVHDAEFLDGSLANGISLGELMDTLGPQAFGSTAENLARGEGNTNPRRAIRQAPAARLSPAGLSWMSERLELAFQEIGKLSPAALAGLDWPEG